MSKKYIHKDVQHRQGALVYTEIGPSPQGDIIFISMERGREQAHVLTAPYVAKNMIEYKEPRRGTYWMNIYEDGPGGIWPTKEEVMMKSASVPKKLLATVEIPWVEGQGLDCGCPKSMTCSCQEIKHR